MGSSLRRCRPARLLLASVINLTGFGRWQVRRSVDLARLQPCWFRSGITFLHQASLIQVLAR